MGSKNDGLNFVMCEQDFSSSKISKTLIHTGLCQITLTLQVIRHLSIQYYTFYFVLVLPYYPVLLFFKFNLCTNFLIFSATINEEKEKSEKTYFDTLISHGK